MEEPDIDAFHWVEGPKQPTYRVTFYQKDLWYAIGHPKHMLCQVLLILQANNKA